MEILTLVEKAVKGGWQAQPENYQSILVDKNDLIHFVDSKGMEDVWNLEVVLLQPTFWKAVSKMDGWVRRCEICGRNENSCSREKYLSLVGEIGPDDKILCFSRLVPGAKYHMNRMIDLLWSGKSLKDYIKTL